MNTKILNICLIPNINDAAALYFKQQLQLLSAELNKEHPSLYELSDNNSEGEDSKFSFPHCTIMHLKVPIDTKINSFLADKLQAIIGKEINLNITNLKLLQANAFIRDSLLTDKPPYLPCNLYWLAVERNEALLTLQEKIFSAIQHPAITPITGRQDNYQPHFTLWVKEEDQQIANVMQPQVLMQKYFANAKQNFSVACKIAVGNCGPIGQVTQINLTPEVKF